MEPTHDDQNRAQPGKRGIGFRVGMAVLVIVALLGIARAIDMGRMAVAADDLVPWEAGLAAGLAAAEAAGKPALINFTADWCGPCQRMKADVFSDQEIADAIVERFVPVKVDMTAPRPGGPEYEAAQRYEVPGMPTFVVTTADGTPVSMRVGGHTAEQFVQWMRALE